MTNIILAITIFIVLSAYNYFLLAQTLISSDNFVVIFIAILLVSLVVGGWERVKKVDLLKGVLELREVKKQLKDIKEATILLVGLIARSSSYSSGNWMQRKELNDRMERALEMADAKPKEVEEIMKLARITEKFMKDEKLTEKEQKLIDEHWSLNSKIP